MNLEFSQEEIKFRQEIRQWMKENVPEELRQCTARGAMPDKAMQQHWEGLLAKQGWLTVTWPEQYGGPGWTATQRYIFDLERAMSGAPATSPFGVSMVGPVLYTFGSDEHKERWLAGIRNGETLWCQGYSEPNAGSDLASLKTRAERQGDHYLVNGQKIWTTQAHWADMMFCLVRTDTSVKAQQGISFLLIDMTSPGIEVRPIYSIDGHHHLNEVYFTDVKVPAENLVGSEGMGWTIAKFLLTHERTTIAGVADIHFEIERMKTALKQRDEEYNASQAARRVAELEIDLMALEYTNFRTVAATDDGKPFGPESSGLKIKGTELQQQASQAMVELGRIQSLPWDNEQVIGSKTFNCASRRYNFLRACTIYGGSNEIQKNVLAKMLLGL
ncbi:MAG: acyl-CoA dehydrogenase family protein [Gammaproteobacteria bacterium]|nr:acyl-CoA dehydrogenase family protein [Gammaproteobacteria bacterium]MBQ0775676.1 acyl-CoA dehydrogenase family protein [Gammaproteobacteria bacterium]MDF1781138.1 acyl-CoA dehydrogenase family protein [Alcanivoracaceae bacterium]